MVDWSDEIALFQIKVILAGDRSVGKSSLLCRYAFDEFSDGNEATTETTSHTTLTKVPGLGPVKIETWDLTDRSQWSAVEDSFYANSHAMAVVFDLNRPETIQHLPDWISVARSRVPGIPVLIVANKTDLPCKVPSHKIAKWAKDNDYDYVEVSSKTKHNLEAMFEKLGTMGINFALKSR